MAKEKSPRRRGASTTASPGTPAPTVAPEERRHMIEEAAYYRAQQRGFDGGDPVEDWLAAEREINRMLPSPQQQKRELAAYQQLRQSVEKILGDTRETLNAETIRQALDKSVAQLKQLGEYTADTIDKVAASVEKDMANAAQAVGQKLEAFSGKTADLFQVWRDRGSQFLTAASTALGDWLREAAEPLKQRTYRAGEMAASGTLECTACGERVVLDTPAHVPPCPKCRKGEFRRVP
jgi:Zinc-ribbon containing domain/Protein of unknown function (DUF2934)